MNNKNYDLRWFLLIVLNLSLAACGGNKISVPNEKTTTPSIVVNTTLAPTISATTTNTLTLIPLTETRTVVPVGELKVIFLDVGQGDAELIITPRHKAILIDGGEQGSGVIQYLTKYGISQIDLMIATHPHSDHIGGLVEVINSMKVVKVITGGQSATTGIYEQFLDGIANSKAEYEEVKMGDKFTFDGLTFEVLYPASAVNPENLNNASIVLRLTFNDVSLLFMGDADQYDELEILTSDLPISANILKVGHHGSSTSTSFPFLNKVNPEIAIYSAGIGNPYGFPDPNTLARLASIGAIVYGTDVNGTSTVIVSEHGYKIAFEKGKPRLPTEPSSIIEPTLNSIPTENSDGFLHDDLSVLLPALELHQLCAKTIPVAN